MKKGLLFCCILICVSVTVNAQSITDALDNWIIGTNSPEISTGDLPTGGTGSYIHMLIGTSPMYYEVMTEGEGTVDFWVYDPGMCLEDADQGYGTNGPIWGLQNPLYQCMTVGIIRKSYIQWCRGYNVWSSVAPYSPWWYKEYHGLRATNGAPFTPGWYRWAVDGTWDDATFWLFNVSYYTNPDNIRNDLPSDVAVGDLSQTIDATSFGGSLESAFGEGWKAFYLKGDGGSGIEDVNIFVTGGSGVFDEFGASPVAGQYTRSSWAGVKGLFR